MSIRTERPCTHCGTAMEVDASQLDGPAFCCHGCEMAFEIIQGAGLGQYYDERETSANRPTVVRDGGWSQVPQVELEDGTKHASLRIDGLQCAACVWVTEKVLQDTPGVTEARVSYATGRCELQWNPEAVQLDDVLGKVARLGYQPRALDVAQAPDRDILLRLGVAIFSAGNVMMFASAVYLGWIDDMAPAYAALFRWTSLALATPVALWSAGPFFRSAWAGLQNRVLHMDLPISIAVAVLYAHGVYATLNQTDGYLDSLTMLVALLLVGRLLEQRGRRRAAEAAQALAAQAPRVVRRVTADGVEEVASDALAIGDRIAVSVGEEVGGDGRVTGGGGSVQMSLLTGESEPVPLTVGDRVITGAVLVEGELEVEVEAAASESVLARMAAGLREAADRPVDPSVADRIAPWFTAATLLIAALTYAGMALLGGDALEATIAVLVVACPCALSLARPLALSAGLGAAARRGLLFRSGDALLKLADVDLVVLDKTGTVTGGRPEVLRADDSVLRLAAGLERASIHPVARAILEEAGKRRIALPRATQLREVAGVGVAGVIDGRPLVVRSAGPGRVQVVEAPDPTAPAAVVIGEIILADAVRTDSRGSIDILRDLGVDVALLTGDHPEVADRIAREAGIDVVAAGMTPDQKSTWIASRQSSGRTVLFVGDGLNDGPALAAADVGVAMGSGAASSVLVADAVVAAESLGPVVAGLRAARAARVAVQRNLRRSLLYNVVAVSAAVVGFVNPLVAAISMPLSSALVIFGALAVERTVARAERTTARAQPAPSSAAAA